MVITKHRSAVTYQVPVFWQLTATDTRNSKIPPVLGLGSGTHIWCREYSAYTLQGVFYSAFAVWWQSVVFVRVCFVGHHSPYFWYRRTRCLVRLGHVSRYIVRWVCSHSSFRLFNLPTQCTGGCRCLCVGLINRSMTPLLFLLCLLTTWCVFFCCLRIQQSTA